MIAVRLSDNQDSFAHSLANITYIAVQIVTNPQQDGERNFLIPVQLCISPGGQPKLLPKRSLVYFTLHQHQPEFLIADFHNRPSISANNNGRYHYTRFPSRFQWVTSKTRRKTSTSRIITSASRAKKKLTIPFGEMVSFLTYDRWVSRCFSFSFSWSMERKISTLALMVSICFACFFSLARSS